MTMKNDEKSEEELTCCFKIDMFQNWHKVFDKFWLESLKSLKNLLFNGLLLTKVYNVWA